MQKMTPFANESDSLQIGELTIENRLDRLSLYGSLSITRDKAGLARAQALKALLDATVSALKNATLPEQISIEKPDKTQNPFK